MNRDDLKRAFDAGWQGAIRWTMANYPDNMGNKIYVETLEEFLVLAVEEANNHDN